MSVYKDKNGLLVVESTEIHEPVEEGVEGYISPPGHKYAFHLNTLGNELGRVDFQLGPVGEVGVNGVTSEAVLAVLIHRTEILNQLYPCTENTQAISHMRDALAQFNSRTYIESCVV